MGEQFRMARKQRVAFTPEEVKLIDQARDVITTVTGQPVTTNKFVKKTTLERARKVNEGASDA